MDKLYFDCTEVKGNSARFDILENGNVMITIYYEDGRGNLETEVILDKFEALKIIEFLGGSL